MRRSTRALLSVLAVCAIAATACGSDKKTDATSGGSPATAPAVKIGAQDFGESAILAEIYKQGLEAKGYKVSIVKLGGFRPLEVPAFDTGTINFAPEYAASMLEFLNSKKGEATGDAKATTAKLQTYLDAKKLKALEPSAAVDTNAFVVTKATADKYGLKSLSDLASKGAALTLGAPSDCLTNPFCVPGLKAKYGLDLSAKTKSLATAQIAPALEANQIDIALLFSTDSTIKSKGWVLLTDDKSMLAADNVVPVVSNELAAVGDLTKATNAISAKLTTEKLLDLNARYDVNKEDAAVVAKDFLKTAGLI